MPQEASNHGRKIEELFRMAIKYVYEEAKKNPLLRDLMQQILTSCTIRQVMNESVRPHLVPLVKVIGRVVELILNKEEKRIASMIRSDLQKLMETTGKSCTLLRTTQKQLSQEAGEEVIESTVKTGTGQTVAKITATKAAKDAAKSSLMMGALVDGTLLAFYTANDYWKYKNGELNRKEVKKRFYCNATSAVGSTTGGTAGAAAGAAIGTVICPGIGTALGAIAGNIIGGTLGSTAGYAVGDIFTS